ncbi:pilus assembly protein CpaE [Salsipaludibacter albus]|uniref:pilus assembly protein CpaE n=1 Tax=Salsipaludibacter albus TaxID=2849650 RepID=UPI001EE42D33|nr:pilus assembly protein CpaE [Salsipaludibacter albus]MBY5160980.1 pilus assembly protein CpaE [Salsipaludibacter albus]
MISLHLARWLRDAGLAWEPAPGDEFLVPDHGMDDRVFVIAEMVVQVRHLPTGTIIALNGTTEWALDSLMLSETLWMPREDQLREVLGDAFLSLERRAEDWAVRVRLSDGTTTGVVASTPVDAWAKAVLVHLRGPD